MRKDGFLPFFQAKICFYCSGYVPEHGKALVDHGVGYAVGHDAIHGSYSKNTFSLNKKKIYSNTFLSEVKKQLKNNILKCS